MVNYGDLIHEAIHAVLYDHDWPSITTNHRVAPEVGFVRASGPATEKPTAILIDQANSTFEDAGRHGRALLTDRTDWIWDAKAAFAGHVSVEELEILLQSPIIIARDVSGLPRQVTIRLLDAAYQSPARQQSTSGSKVQFRFSATLSPL
ncbi:hypothetical protein LCGC14_1498140 [marine sediment metagenome]|uniref:Uncharacterized protein n=1 Tax=marine sediment metagenome TaxID=412755 RepID=A0A0F9J4W9_9ZZZZ